MNVFAGVDLDFNGRHFTVLASIVFGATCIYGIIATIQCEFSLSYLDALEFLAYSLGTSAGLKLARGLGVGGK
ncbi:MULTISPECIES: hypothetical protein [unclassified Bradyrhizobium]|uniref:hypothetical protein n=1 Tax=Bradyrhizobium sp. USDA 4541 TaxID=2817704 RepID=UPI0020A4A276|nr:hypothetical protein [Bradyrhizobium sp. USDA 4541]MCP1846755.1 hypothetical protein [Bradyrhizobium sp. USDA 4541]